MDNISQFVLGISTAAVFIGMLFMLAPTGSMAKSVRYIFTIIFLCACTSLFMGVGDIDLNFVADTPVVDLTAAKQLTGKQAEYICEAALREEKISFNKISANTDIDESGSIFINRITVYSGDDASRIEQIIQGIVEVNEVRVE